MPKVRRLILITLLGVASAGCSSGDDDQQAKSAGGAAKPAAPLPSLGRPGSNQLSSNQPGSDQPSEGAADSVATELVVDTHASSSATEPLLPQTLDLFSPPKTPAPVAEKEPEPEPEPAAVAPAEAPQPEIPIRPPLRLLGFVDVDGVKALLNVNGELNVVAVGDAVNGVEVVGVQAPNVTLQHESEEFQLNLFDQEWLHVTRPSGALVGRPRSLGSKPIWAPGNALAISPKPVRRPRTSAVSRAPMKQRERPAAPPELPGLPGNNRGGNAAGSGESSTGLPPARANEISLPQLPGMGGAESSLPQFGADGLPQL